MLLKDEGYTVKHTIMSFLQLIKSSILSDQGFVVVSVTGIDGLTTGKTVTP